MKQAKTRSSPRVVRDADADTMRPEYDFSKGVRGATAERYAAAGVPVILDPDVRKYFPTSEAVNSALRELVGVARRATVRRKPPR